VCWYVYDPARGDEVWQVAPATPWSELPPHWSCPNCSATKDHFLVEGRVGDDIRSDNVIAASSTSAKVVSDPTFRAAQLEAAFRAVARRMEGLPIVNAALEVEAVGFAPWEGRWLGVMLTPWCMNLMLVPQVPACWHSLVPGRRYYHHAGDFGLVGAQWRSVIRSLALL
jgi:rubredoxin